MSGAGVPVLALAGDSTGQNSLLVRVRTDDVSVAQEHMTSAPSSRCRVFQEAWGRKPLSGRALGPCPSVGAGQADDHTALRGAAPLAGRVPPSQSREQDVMVTEGWALLLATASAEEVLPSLSVALRDKVPHCWAAAPVAGEVSVTPADGDDRPSAAELTALAALAVPAVPGTGRSASAVPPARPW